MNAMGSRAAFRLALPWLVWPSLLGAQAEPARPGPARDTVRIALLAADSEVATGVQLGVEEAQRTGALLGLAVDALSDTARAGALTAFVGGHDAASCRALAEAAARRGVLYLNTRCREPGLRDTARYPTTFHVVPASRAGVADSVAWSSELSRYGGAQLNRRFSDRFGRAMSAGAWTGWMAVKVITEAAMRGRSADPVVLARLLRSPRTRFDGHKGTPLVFGSGQELMQPLYPSTTVRERGEDQ